MPEADWVDEMNWSHRGCEGASKRDIIEAICLLESGPEFDSLKPLNDTGASALAGGALVIGMDWAYIQVRSRGSVHILAKCSSCKRKISLFWMVDLRLAGEI